MGYAGVIVLVVVGIALLFFFKSGGLNVLNSATKGLSSKISQSSSQTGNNSTQTIHGDMSKGEQTTTQSRADSIDSGLMQSAKVLSTPPSDTTYTNAVNTNNVRANYEKNSNYFATLETPSSDSHVDSSGFADRASKISKSLDYSTSLQGSEIALGASLGRDSALELEEKQIESKRASAIAESLYGSSVDQVKSGYAYYDKSTGRYI